MNFVKLKMFVGVFLCLAVLVSSNSLAMTFNKSTDILIAQFDNRPDTDDMHAQAALGCMLLHPDFAGVNVFAVQHAYGKQTSRVWYSDSLFDMIFGPKGPDTWIDTEDGWNGARDDVVNKVTPILQAGGQVWVQEAGQSNFTRDWVEKVINDNNGISTSDTQDRVHVVQHSDWNENKTTQADLNYVKTNTDYNRIADGNDSGNGTPKYKSENNSWLNSACDQDNPNTTARDYWREARDLIDFGGGNSTIKNGGVDYSDCVENWWIFNIGTDADTVAKFWDRYVTNNPGNEIPPAPPTGLVATSNVGSVSLDWADNSEDDLAGYNVYRRTTSSGYSSIIRDLMVSEFVDDTVSNGTKYYYAVTAVDTSGNQSGYSPEDSALPPDLTDDLKIDLKDLAQLAQEWQIVYDINDLSAIAQNWLSGTPESGLPIGETIWLYSDFTLSYVTVDAGDGYRLEARDITSVSGVTEHFIVEDAGGGTILLKAVVNNNYVKVDPAQVNKMYANTTSTTDPLAQYQWTNLGGGKIRLTNVSNGLNVLPYGNQKVLRANVSTTGPETEFIWGIENNGINNPPYFLTNPIIESNATEDSGYSSSIADDAFDPDGDPMTFSKSSGPGWLIVSTSGELSGIPTSDDVGPNSFVVAVDDGQGGHDSTALEILVNSGGQTQAVAYIYGDVSKNGDIPSGDDAPYDQMLLTDSGDTGLSKFKNMVEAEGYIIEQFYDQDTQMTSSFLDDYDVVIFGLHQKIWSSSEKAALDQWLNDGGGMFIYSDSASGGKWKIVGAQNSVGQTVTNNLIGDYGMEVTVDQANGVKAYRAGPGASHPIVVGRPIIEGEGVSPVAVDPQGPAVVLIPYVNDSDYKVSGNPDIPYQQNLTISNPDFAALAYSPVGNGLVVVAFDRQPMWNNGPGSDIDQRDNEEILRRIINFLAE